GATGALYARAVVPVTGTPRGTDPAGRHRPNGSEARVWWACATRTPTAPAPPGLGPGGQHQPVLERHRRHRAHRGQPDGLQHGLVGQPARRALILPRLRGGGREARRALAPRALVAYR